LHLVSLARPLLSRLTEKRVILGTEVADFRNLGGIRRKPLRQRAKLRVEAAIFSLSEEKGS